MLENLPPITCLSLFSIKGKCYYSSKGVLGKKFLQTSTAKYLGEEEFSKIHFAWCEDGLFFNIEVEEPFQEIAYPDFRKGDSVELFLDTRDAKESFLITKFCHHFVFFAKPTSRGFFVEEFTRFRGDDVHDLADPAAVDVKCQVSKRGYLLEIFLHKETLFGFDVELFNRIGFTYRINRLNGAPQHFSVTSNEYVIERSPELWGSFQLLHE